LSIIDKLNAADKNERLDALREIARMYKAGEIEAPAFDGNVNNHIHTTYSFSPYSPAKSVYLAWAAGLSTAGIMDHDSVGGAPEFIEAGKIIGLPVTVGFEQRVCVKGTPLEGRFTNNPDQKSTAYLTMHAIPHQSLNEAEAFLKPYREKRNLRNRKMVERLNKKITVCGLELDFDRDVLPLSQYADGGTVTERHILYALAKAMTDLELPRHFLLMLFKAQLVESFYVDADEELPHITEFLELSKKLGAIPAYPYLGDVDVSVTGDKKAQAFEDSYLDILIDYVKNAGFKAVSYMPARNSLGQLQRLMEMCRANGLFQISGEDINSPFQSFVCEKLVTPEFRHLIDAAWALIGHELASEAGLEYGMFSEQTMKKTPDLYDRINFFAKMGRSLHAY